MIYITTRTIDNYRVVQYRGHTIDKFHIIGDDFAYTHCNESASAFRKMSEEDFINMFPEFFL